MVDYERVWDVSGDKVPWQLSGPHNALVKHINALTDGKPNQHILVPLCGISDDLIWLADQGHSVVGVEGVRKAIKLFFEKNKLEYELSAINIAPSGAYIYKAKSKNITIVQVDFFHFRQSIVGRSFDAIWDRAALLSVIHGTSGDEEIQVGKKYLQVLKDVLIPEGKVLLETLLFDPNEAAIKDGGPGPHFLATDRLAMMCAGQWNMKQIDLIPAPANVQEDYAL